MQEIVLNITYTKAQIQNLYRYLVLPIPKAKFFMAFVSLLVFGVTAIFLFVVNPVKPFDIRVVSVAKQVLIFVSLIWSLVLFLTALMYFYLPTYNHKNNIAFRGDFTITLANDGLNFTQEINEPNVQQSANGLVKWDTFTHKAENAEFIILFQQKKHAVFPKSAFKSEVEIGEFRTFVNEQTHIKPKKFNGTLLWGSVAK